MNNTKEIVVTGFALFSMFFGAGNLILPPFLGKNAGDTWHLVTIGFFITAVIIPFLGILAHAKLQGTMYDFGKKVSHKFSLLYCIIVYAISISLPAPRTASVTYEMAIQPYFEMDSWIVSSIYFLLVFIFAMNRSKVLDMLGKYLTPLIIFILLAVIITGTLIAPDSMNSGSFDRPLISGILEGYQTFDAIGSIVVGGVLIVSLNFNNKTSYGFKRNTIVNAGIIAGIALLCIYGGLIYNGAVFSSIFSNDATRTQILQGISTETLGNIGTQFLSVLVALACFTTAVGIITGTADYIKTLFKNSDKAYTIMAALGCLIGVVVGQFDVHYIIVIALPALMFIYPITVALILLNLVPNTYAKPIVFKTVVLITFLFSIPDFLGFIVDKNKFNFITNLIPLANNHLGWVLPALITFIITNLVIMVKNEK